MFVLRSDVMARKHSGEHSPSSASLGGGESSSDSARRVRQLEGRVATLKSQHGQFRQDVIASMDAKTQEIQQLQRDNERLLKENRALKQSGAAGAAAAAPMPSSADEVCCCWLVLCSSLIVAVLQN